MIVGALQTRKMQTLLHGCLRSTSRHDNKTSSARGLKIPVCGSLTLLNSSPGEVAPIMFFGAMGFVSSPSLQQEALLNIFQLVRVRQCWRRFCDSVTGVAYTKGSSIIVEHIDSYCSSHTDAVAYIYCNYKERVQQTCKNLINSLIQQLIQRGSLIPEALRSLYDQSRNQGRPPLQAELLDILYQVVSGVSTVFFVIDALDESREDDGTRSMLTTKLRELLPNARFVYTSRRLTEIERQFEGCFHLEIRATNEDIRRHLESRISEEPRLSKHIAADPSLLQLISNSIVAKSDGM